MAVATSGNQPDGAPGAILESPRCALHTSDLSTVRGPALPLLPVATVDALGLGPSRKEALETWGDWLAQGWDWSWFVTMTFDPGKVRNGTRTTWGWASTDRAWSDFIEHVTPSARDEQGLSGSVWWVRGREPHHDSGGTHFHGLLGGLPETVSRRDAWAWLKDRCGINRIEPYNPSRGAAHYLTKYVVKELGDVQFSPNLGLHRRQDGHGG